MTQHSTKGYTQEYIDAFIMEHYNKPGWTTSKIADFLGLKSGNSTVNRYHRIKGTKEKYKPGEGDPALHVKPPKAEPGMPKLRFLGEK